MIKLLQYTFLVAVSFASLPAFSMDEENEGSRQKVLAKKIANFQENNPGLDVEEGIQKCLGVINGHANYLWLTFDQKYNLLEELASVTNSTAEEKIDKFNLQLQEIEDTRKQTVLAKKIANFQKDNPGLDVKEGIQKCLGVINGHANYLWLTFDQKYNLLEELASVTNSTAEEKINRFNFLLEQMTVESTSPAGNSPATHDVN